jgi:hypothetical protein
MKLLFNFCLNLFLLFCLGSESYANTFVRKPVCEWYPKAEVVFVGTATKISEVTRSSARIRFAVKEQFKGVSTPDIELDCYGFLSIGGGLSFSIDENYLVAAYRDEKGALRMGSCDLSTPTSSVAAEVIFLRSLNEQNRPNTVVYGTISRWETAAAGKQPELRALAGIPLQLSGPSGVLKAVSRSDGYFEFLDVVRGEYSMTPSLPKTMRQDSRRTVTVGSSGCADASLIAQ